MLRVMIVSCVFLLSGLLHAQSMAPDFKWRGNDQFFFTFSGGVIKGSLRDGERAEPARQGPYTAHVRSFKANGRDVAFITVILIQDGKPTGQLYIYEQQNSLYRLMNERPINGNAATLVADLDASVDGASKVNGWDPSTSLRSLINYTVSNPTKMVNNFADDVELGRIKEVPKPLSRVAQQPSGPPVRPLPPGRQAAPVPPLNSDDLDDDQIAAQQPQRPVARIEQEPAPRQRMVQQPPRPRVRPIDPDEDPFEARRVVRRVGPRPDLSPDDYVGNRIRPDRRRPEIEPPGYYPGMPVQVAPQRPRRGPGWPLNMFDNE